MKKPVWMCGTAERWQKMSFGIGIINLLRKPVSTALFLGGEVAAGGALVTAGFSANISTSLPAFAVTMTGIGMLVASLSCFLANLETLSQNVGMELGRFLVKKSLLTETEDELSALAKTAAAAGEAASTEKTKFLTEVVESEALKALEEVKKLSLDKGENDRVAIAARAANPTGFSNGDEWHPSALEVRLGNLGAVATDGIAAASLAAGMLKEKDLDASSKSELERVTGDLLPRLIEAFEKVPNEERERTLQELDKSPKEAFKEGVSAALERVLKVRATLTARAKVEVEAEKNVLKSGI